MGTRNIIYLLSLNNTNGSGTKLSMSQLFLCLNHVRKPCKFHFMIDMYAENNILAILCCAISSKNSLLRSRVVKVVVFNATFTKMSVISWRSRLLVEETGSPEKTTGMSQVTKQSSSHKIVSSTPHRKW